VYLTKQAAEKWQIDKMTKQISSKEQFVSNFILNEEYKVAIENDTYPNLI
jgi:hypothetical protein